MNEEKEIKVKILEDITFDELKKIIENIFGIKFGEPKHDSDIYYDLENNYYFNLNHSLRIRNNDEIAYKALFYIPERISNPWFVLEEEYKLPILKKDFVHLLETANISYKLGLKDSVNIEGIKNTLKKLKFDEHIKINKKRIISKNDEYTLFIDFVENLGLFVEIEAKKDEYLNYFRKKLPFKYEEIRHGYVSLYVEKVMNLKIPNFKELFLLNPKWNILKGQEDIIEKLKL